jgi:hypothetical protein
MCKFSFKHDLEPHDAKTRQLLRDALAAWNESQKAAKKIGRPNVPKVKSPKKDRRSPPAPAQRPIYATTTSTALVDLDRLNGQVNKPRTQKNPFSCVALSGRPGERFGHRDHGGLFLQPSCPSPSKDRYSRGRTRFPPSSRGVEATFRR